MKIQALDIKEVGRIEELRQGIVKISGLPNCAFGAVIEFDDVRLPNGQLLKGMIVEFNAQFAFGIVFGDERKIKVGDKVFFKKYGPDEIQIDGKKYLVGEEADILAIIS